MTEPVKVRAEQVLRCEGEVWRYTLDDGPNQVSDVQAIELLERTAPGWDTAEYRRALDWARAGMTVRVYPRDGITEQGETKDAEAD